ncbi:MAG: hypothetical protein AAB336_10270 [Acidobacteriota bacterium]
MESPHIEIEKLTDLVVGRVSDLETKEVSAHLAGCPTCAILKMRLEKTIGLMQSDNLEEVPSHTFERTLDLFNQRPLVFNNEKSSIVKKIFGIIESATSGMTPVFGLRSGQPELTQQIKLSADEFEVFLQVSQKEENFRVFGELFSRIIANQAILRNSQVVLTASINDLGEFSFTNVKSGIYQLVITLNDVAEIEFPEITIG